MNTAPEVLTSRAGYRIEFWRKSIEFVRAAPIIGHGTGAARELFGRAAVGQTGGAAELTVNPHNQTFAVANQLGLLGAAVLFAFWFSHLMLFRGESLLAWAGLLIVAQNVVGSLFNSHLFDFAQGWLYVIGVGVGGGMVMRRDAAARRGYHDPGVGGSRRMTQETAVEPYGELAPGLFDAAIIAVTGGLPRNWLGMRLAIGLRRLVTKRLRGDPGLDVNRWGLRLRLHPLRNGCEKGLLFTPQFYEAGEREELHKRIAAAAGRPFIFIDIGANVGLFSFFVAADANSNARILAIEPELENLRRLRFNLDANPGLPIRVLPVALGAAQGVLEIEINRSDRGGTRTRPPLDIGQADAANRVECRTLLQVLVQENVQSIDALKIDVEGVEDTILVPFFRDAPQSLWPRFLIIEDTQGFWRVDLFSELQARGYRVASRTRLNVMWER